MKRSITAGALSDPFDCQMRDRRHSGGAWGGSLVSVCPQGQHGAPWAGPEAETGQIRSLEHHLGLEELAVTGTREPFGLPGVQRDRFGGTSVIRSG
ncbi:hypothetical protein GCM10027061_15040 [Nesterenkonia suensis]